MSIFTAIYFIVFALLLGMIVGSVFFPPRKKSDVLTVQFAADTREFLSEIERIRELLDPKTDATRLSRVQPRSVWRSRITGQEWYVIEVSETSGDVVVVMQKRDAIPGSPTYTFPSSNLFQQFQFVGWHGSIPKL